VSDSRRYSPLFRLDAISQQKRKRTEPFGRTECIGGVASPMLRGIARFTLTMGYDLVRSPKLLGSRGADNTSALGTNFCRRAAYRNSLGKILMN
jgi:hypothetical protein